MRGIADEQAAGPPVAARLQRIAAEVLACGEVGLEQNLLALGADSLRAIELLGRVEDAFGVELQLDELFAAPTVAALAGRIESALQAAPAAAVPPPRWEASAAAQPPPAAAPAAPPGAQLPLSFAQRRLWFLHQLDPLNPVHNLAAVVRFSGRLDVRALAAALAECVRRHAALRTAFRAGAAEPWQEAQPPAALGAAAATLPLLDLVPLRRLPVDAPHRRGGLEGAARAAARDLARLPFDLERGRLARFALLRLAGEEHDLVLAFHHIAADGASLAVLAGELTALYGAFAAGRPSPLPEPALQYADYALWQRARFTAPGLAPGLAYWRGRLGGAPPAVELPADRPRPPVLSHRGAHLERRLAPAVAAGLAARVQEERATPFMGWLAGFAALLARHGGQDDLVLGMPVAGRGRPELAGLVGVFLNNLVLRLEVTAGASWRQLLGQVREVVLAAFAHQEVPFELLVDDLRAGRDLSRNPLFQILFVGQNAPLRRQELPGLRLAPREVDLGTARFDLALSLADTGGDWLGTWKFSADLFDPATVARLAGHFENLLGAALAAPDRPLDRLAMLSAAESHQLLVAWNDTAAGFPEGSCLHELVASQAARTPWAVAVEMGGERLTYAELLERARQVAARLRSLGAGPESRVGVAADRSLAMVAGLLGTLLAGAAYVPLDPDHPAGRLAAMLEDAGIEALLVQGRGRQSLGAAAASLAAAGRVLDLASPLAASPVPSAAPGAGRAALPAPLPAAVRPGPESPAYVIFTSGSTGRPKGVVVPHRGIVNRLVWMQRAYGLGADDRVLQKTPFGFDVSVWELFWPLLAGARLVMAPPGAHQDPARLLEAVEGHLVTTLHFVPSMLQVFVEQPGLGAACASLRRVFASGEALPAELAEKFAGRLPGVPLHNLYGPTEASVDVTFHACGGAGARRPVPIGRPVANTSILVLDRALGAAPVGVPGELHIGGVGLARGYLGRPDLTAERFVPAPWGDPGGRLYKSGDLARFRADGEVEFLGRLDHQVKLHGVRVELGEIEAALAAHPRIREAVVLARRAGPAAAAPAAATAASAAAPPAGGAAADLRLVAYLVAHADGGGAAPAPAELRAFLRRTLPEAMVPSAFVALAAMPQSPHGKVDRKALPPPQPPAATEDSRELPQESPRTPLERRVAALFAAQLGLAGASEVAAGDNFFALGGDSIQGALLINRLQRELGTVLYVMSLFDHPTVAEFAAHLAASYGGALAAAGWSAAVDSTAAGPGSGAAGVDDAAGAAAPRGPAPAQEAAEIATLRAFLVPRFSAPASAGGPAAAAAPPRKPRAVFLLSPFRSGSTLLRVMLAGHPRLFSPPELELLGFASLGERRRVLSGRDAFAREGLLRAVMELRACDAGSAAAVVGEAEERDEPTASFYRRLVEWAGDRLLVDKTPRYSLDPATLRRAESWFEAPLYVHLVRHPAATVQSYLEARMDEVYRFPLAPRRQAEAVWRLAHESILDFLAAVPARRQHRLRFEDLVGDPAAAARALCGFLGVPYDPALLSPYEGKRMTDGLHAAGRMMGDPKFLQHGRIEAAVAQRWRDAPSTGFGGAAVRLAERLGYSFPQAGPAPAPRPRPSRRGAADPAAAGAPPLSFAQQRLWFLDRLHPGASVYNMPAALRLSGRLSVPALAAACHDVERRHEVLRTVFPEAGGRPRQRIAAVRRRPLPVVDLAALAAGARRDEVARQVDGEAHRPFDLQAGPLWRRHLLRLGVAEHVLVVNFHHVVCDGWSIGVLTRELAALYGAFAGATAAPLAAPAPVQYADFAVWQRERIAGEWLAAELGFWRQRLADPPPALDLPLDRPRPAVQEHRGRRLACTLPAAAVEPLRAFGREAEATLFMVLAAILQTLLHRYTGQTDVAIGTPVANRNRAELEGMIGVFVNTVVLRTDLSGEPAARTLLGRVAEVCRDAFRHEELPFEKLVEELGVERTLGRSPLFSAMLAWQSTPPPEIALAGLAAERLPVHTRTAKFDLTFDLAARPDGGLDGALEYDTGLFDAATARRLVRHFANLAAAVGSAGPQPLSQLSLLAPEERHQLAIDANDTGAPPAPGATVLHLLAATAGRTPAAVAVEMAAGTDGSAAAAPGAGRLTYGELAARAAALGRRLVRLGVGPDVPVAIYAERSPALVAAVWGVLAAGGAYLPLDLTHPPERLSGMLADSAVPVLLTERPLLARLPNLAVRVVLLDEEPEVAAGPAAPLFQGPGPAPENLAYVIYTSGSTGRPKGVEVTHRSVVNYLGSMAVRPGLGAGDVMLALTTLSFDIAVTELLLPAMVGARVVIAGRETAADAARLAAVVQGAGVTCMQATPATWNLLLDHGWRGEPGLKALCGGEALPRALAERLLPRVASLWNVYGPTETTVWSTLQEVAAGDRAVAIGRPVDNTSVHVLGRHGELAPPGAAGELVIGGQGLARGYRGRPDLTAERFVPDPHGEPGARLYRTGDLARRLPDGALDHLGRIDRQVKLRGVRIEVGEIEAVLGEHPAVRQCTVIAVGARPADRRLVAYVTPAAGHEPSREDLRGYLKKTLPAAMVPAAVVVLDRLPLLPSGKVDRLRLPDPGHDRPDLASSYVAPGSERERQVAAVWQRVLGLDQVGIHDNFFDLGGHSLLAAEVQGKLREELGLDLQLVDLFRHPTVQALAAHLDGGARAEGGGPERGGGGRSELDAARLARERQAVRRRRAALARQGGGA